jgi:5-methylcytosine-specific restriction protein A
MSSADFVPQIKLGAVLTNDELNAVFKGQTQSGMRRSKATNSLVLTTSRDNVYLDRWEGDLLHYTGMGLTGHQSLEKDQNRTLAESASNGVAVFLVEVFGPNQYVFLGRVALAGAPYSERQPDREGKQRMVWMFPLRLSDESAPAVVPRELVERASETRTRRARRLGDAELAKRARLAARTPSQRPTTSRGYERDPYVSELAKRRAEGTCQLCEQRAPFTSRSGEPYLETHHIVWLARGGEDSIANTVALCPNCHRRVHELEAGSDIRALRVKAGES